MLAGAVLAGAAVGGAALAVWAATVGATARQIRVTAAAVMDTARLPKCER